MTRDGFQKLVEGWRADGFDTLMARISMVGDWVSQNGGSDNLTAEEGQVVTDMMFRAVRFGVDGAEPCAERPQ